MSILVSDNLYKIALFTNASAEVDPIYFLFPIYARYDFSKSGSISVDGTDQILQANDLTGNGHHAVKPVAGNAPIYTGMTAKFNRANSEWLQSNDLATQMDAAHTTFCVFKPGDLVAASATFITLFGSHAAGVAVEVLTAYVNGYLNHADSSGDVIATGAGLVDQDEWHVLCVVAQGAVMYLYIDGVLINTFVDTLESADTFSIGQNNSGGVPSDFAEMELGELVFSDTQVGDADVIAFSNFLKAKWNVEDLRYWYSLFVYENLNAWYDFTRGNTVVKDGGDLIEQNYSRALPIIDLTQTTGASKPLHVASGVSGFPSAQLDGNSDYMNASTPLSGATEFDIYVVASISSHSGGSILFGGRPNTGDNVDALLVEVTASGLMRFIFNNVVLSASDLSVAITVPFLMRVSFDGTIMRCYKNGVISATTAVSSGVVSNITRSLGVLRAGGGPFASFLNGRVAEIGLFDTVLTPTQATDLTNELLSRYNIS